MFRKSNLGQSMYFLDAFMIPVCVERSNAQVVTICTAKFNIQKFYVLPTHCIYAFCVDLRTNSDYFPIQH